jgi:phosphohistidine phosphatase SixA
MPRLVLLRHGDISGRDLSPAGERQASSLALQVEALAPAPRREVWTSPAPRARQTAGPLCARLNLMDPGEDPRLWSGPDGSADSWEAHPLGLVHWLDQRLDQLGLLVIVTHYELCCALPPLLAVAWGLTGTVPRGLARGHGWWVERETNRTGLLIP